MVDRSPTHPVRRRPGTPFPVADDTAALERQVANLRTALRTSRQIGAATGILMTRHGWPYDRALEWMRGVSQASNRKVSDLAEEIVLTGTVDQVAPGPGARPVRPGGRGSDRGGRAGTAPHLERRSPLSRRGHPRRDPAG